jgi:hypothetical protein
MDLRACLSTASAYCAALRRLPIGMGSGILARNETYGRHQMVKDASAGSWSFAAAPLARDTLGS